QGVREVLSPARHPGQHCRSGNRSCDRAGHGTCAGREDVGRERSGSGVALLVDSAPGQKEDAAMNISKILVVDDEPQIRRTLRTVLVQQGYIVFEASTGEQALEAIREQMPDLILLDMNMPGIGGLEACKTIRESSDVAII